jgi:predicted nucleotidyltransferase
VNNRPDSAALIAEMVRRIVKTCDPERIILFGSHARGTPGPDSDADFLVITRLYGDRRDVRLAIRRSLSGIGLSKDVVVVTPEEVERYQGCAGTIIRMALRDGKVLYQRAA